MAMEPPISTETWRKPLKVRSRWSCLCPSPWLRRLGRGLLSNLGPSVRVQRLPGRLFRDRCGMQMTEDTGLKMIEMTNYCMRLLINHDVFCSYICLCIAYHSDPQWGQIGQTLRVSFCSRLFGPRFVHIPGFLLG